MPRRPPCRFASKPPRLLLPEYLQLLEASPWLYDASGRAIDGGRRPTRSIECSTSPLESSAAYKIAKSLLGCRGWQRRSHAVSGI